MITEDYVSFEIAKLLNTKGFKGEFHKYYWGYEPGKEFLTDGSFDPEYDYPTPTLQMAMKWLREKYNIHIEIGFDMGYFPVCISTLTNKPIPYKPIQGKPFTYEEACEVAIKYCLENLI